MTRIRSRASRWSQYLSNFLILLHNLYSYLCFSEIINTIAVVVQIEHFFTNLIHNHSIF
jgi:hypothetical protein